MATGLIATGRKSEISPEEWSLRVDLAACYRMIHLNRWTETIYNHISVRVPGPDLHFLINPFGLLYEEITASNLVKIDIDGNPVDASSGVVNFAGFVIHGAIHESRHDINCVLHTHTTAGIAVSCLEEGLSADNVYGAQLYGEIAYHDFEGISLHEGERPRLVSSLGNRNILILRNHGLLTCGTTVAAAFYRMYVLQRACEVQLASQSSGRSTISLSTEVLERCRRQMGSFVSKGGDEESHIFGQDVFEALRRKLDRHDMSYRE